MIKKFGSPEKITHKLTEKKDISKLDKKQAKKLDDVYEWEEVSKEGKFRVTRIKID